MPHASDTATVNAAMRRSRPGDTKLGNVTGLCAISTATDARARSRPIAAPMSVSTQPSVISCRSSRARPAPSAVRTAISRRRASDRAISRLATFAQAISSTNATAAISVSSAGRSVPTSSTSSGVSSTARFSFVSGYSRSSWREMPSSSRCAAPMLTPGFSRASAANPREPRSAIVDGGAYIANGTQSSAMSLRPLNPGGITPTTVYCRAAQQSVSVRPTIWGSAPNRRFHRPSLRTTTCAGLATASSSA